MQRRRRSTRGSGRSSRTWPSWTTLIVFVTAFDKFAPPAFDADAVDYVTKPLTEARFDETLGRVRERVRARRAVERIDEGTAADAQQGQYVSHLVTRVGTTDVIIPLHAID